MPRLKLVFEKLFTYSVVVKPPAIRITFPSLVMLAYALCFGKQSSFTSQAVVDSKLPE